MLSYIECMKFNYVKEAEIPEQGLLNGQNKVGHCINLK